jgi:glycosyltransferase involved in cell wall biosynthesis
MSLTMYPRYHPLRRVLLNRPLVDISARRATAVITVSESARRDIVRIYNLDPSRVHVVHEAAAPAFRPVCDLAELNRVRRRYGLADRVILYVGTIEPRKNLPRLIDAFALRRRAGDLQHQLVCVGRYGWRSRGIGARIEHARIADAIAYTGYVPFEDLPALYNLAEMFVFPSLHEGFGLPVVEAMACGVPVIAGRTSSLPEVAGGAVEHVDPLDEGALGEAMVRLARSREHRDHLAALGFRRARTVSWERAARETLDVYRQVARQPAGAARVEAPAAFAAGVPGVPGINVGLDPATGPHAARESHQPWVR